MIQANYDRICEFTGRKKRVIVSLENGHIKATEEDEWVVDELKDYCEKHGIFFEMSKEYRDWYPIEEKKSAWYPIVFVSKKKFRFDTAFGIGGYNSQTRYGFPGYKCVDEHPDFEHSYRSSLVYPAGMAFDYLIANK